MRKQVKTTAYNFDKICVTEMERTEGLLADGDACRGGHLHEIFVTLRKIIRSFEERVDKVAELLRKVKILYEKVRSRLASPRAVKVVLSSGKY